MSIKSDRKLVRAAELKSAIAAKRELAILDVREEGVFSRRRLFYSSSAPVARIGLLIDRLVPRRSTPIVLVDEAAEYSARAAAALEALGYQDIAILDGGISGWEGSGFEVFSGTNVPGKAFGELIEHHLHTPNIDALALKQRQAAGDDLVVLDSRPFNEYHTMNIPGGVDCAGAELVYRALAAAPSAETLIVVNCAGRTRSILGAQSLINAGIPNPVAALTGGSMAWLLSGWELEHGQRQTAPRPDAAHLHEARALARQAAAKAGVSIIDRTRLAQFEGEALERTLYRFDVRDPLEYEAGHLPGWRSAPGGQLVQATDEYVGTLAARVVLTDDDGVRARMTASWLLQLGYLEVHVLDLAEAASPVLEAGKEPLRIAGSPERANWIEADRLAQSLADKTAQVIDLDSSLAFRRAHIPGARFVAASALADLLDDVIDKKLSLVLTSEDGVLAGLVANQIRSRAPGVAALLGGTRRWLALDFPSASGDTGNLTGSDDAWYSPYHAAPDQVSAQMNAYLAWELQLVEQVDRDGTGSIKVIDFDTPTARRSRERLASLNATVQTVSAS